MKQKLQKLMFFAEIGESISVKTDKNYAEIRKEMRKIKTKRTKKFKISQVSADHFIIYRTN